MTRQLRIIFCDNEHGSDVTFPDLNQFLPQDLIQRSIRDASFADLRKEAKAAGWGRFQGADYCPYCMESI